MVLGAVSGYAFTGSRDVLLSRFAEDLGKRGGRLESCLGLAALGALAADEDGKQTRRELEHAVAQRSAELLQKNKYFLCSSKKLFIAVVSCAFVVVSCPCVSP